MTCIPNYYMKKKVVILSGAGVSKESGIDTFRDKDGVWAKCKPEEVASIDGWNKNPEKVLDFYNARRHQLLGVEPNRAHELIAALEEWYDVTIITQNVDDLHERAGSSNVIHLHGEMTKVCSSADKENPECIEFLPLDKDIKIGDKAKDGSQLRPYIVWFGEPVPNMYYAANAMMEVDFFIVIGTSLLVSPANVLAFCSNAAKNIVIDPNEVNAPEGFFHIKENATDGMELLYNSLVKMVQA